MTTSHRLASCFLFVLFVHWPCNLEAQTPPGKPKIAMKENDDELRKLQKARYDEASAGLAELIVRSKDVRFSIGDLVEAQRVVLSGLDLYDQPKDQVAFLSQHVETLKLLENQIQDRIKGGVGQKLDLLRVRYNRLDAEIHLLRAKRQADKTKEK